MRTAASVCPRRCARQRALHFPRCIRTCLISCISPFCCQVCSGSGDAQDDGRFDFDQAPITCPAYEYRSGTRDTSSSGLDGSWNRRRSERCVKRSYTGTSLPELAGSTTLVAVVPFVVCRPGCRWSEQVGWCTEATDTRSLAKECARCSQGQHGTDEVEAAHGSRTESAMACANSTSRGACRSASGTKRSLRRSAKKSRGGRITEVSPLPSPLRGGVGGGAVTSSVLRGTPLPTPPPQGRRERTSIAALTESNLNRSNSRPCIPLPSRLAARTRCWRRAPP